MDNERNAKIIHKIILDFCRNARSDRGYKDLTEELYDAYQLCLHLENIPMSKSKLDGLLLGLHISHTLSKD